MYTALERMRASDVTPHAQVQWQSAGPRSTAGTLELARAASVTVADLREDIAGGQIVAQYTLEGRAAADAPWQTLSRGTTIGHCKLDRVAPATIREARLTIDDALEPPGPVRVRLYAA
jgi:alpha-L-fucosidase